MHMGSRAEASSPYVRVGGEGRAMHPDDADMGNEGGRAKQRCMRHGGAAAGVPVQASPYFLEIINLCMYFSNGICRLPLISLPMCISSFGGTLF
jgi:hypothetical protein